MGVLKDSFSLRGGLTDPPSWLREALGAVNMSATGLSVTPRSAMTFAAVYSAVNGISTDIAKLPIEVFKWLKPGDESAGKARATTHPLDPILRDTANEWMTAFEVKQIIQGNALLRGNGYAQILENNSGDITGLFPLPASHVTPYRNQLNELWYRVTTKAGMTSLPAREMFHLRILAGSENPDEGISPITFARESMGLGIAQQEYEGRLYGNDGSPGGILTHPGKLRPESRKALKRSWDESHRGLGKAHQTALLEEGVTWQQVGMKPIDAQFLESRRFQVEEVARWYRYPLHKLFHVDKGDKSSPEWDSIQYVTDCLGGWIESWSSTIKRDLFMPIERKIYVAVFNTKPLLRGDFATRMNGYAVATDHGWMNSDEVRISEDMNPIDQKNPDTGKGIGQDYYRALNMVVQGAPKPKPVPPPANPGPGPADVPGTGDTPQNPGNQQPAAPEPAMSKKARSLELRQRYAAAHRQLFQLAAERLLVSEAQVVMEAAERLLPDRRAQEFTEELQRFYEGFQAEVYERMMPPTMALAREIRAQAAEEVGFDGSAMSADADGFVRDVATSYSRRHAADSLGSLRAALLTGTEQGVPPIDMIRKRLQEWADRPERIAGNESVRAANAVAKATYVEGGVTRFRWVMGTECAFCRQLADREAEISEWFLAEGQTLTDLVQGTLKASTNIGHAPLHDGCSCGISASV